jgi:putative Holliday junction resolvase
VAEEHGRILALDLGKRRIGLALSDELGWTAQGLPNLERRNTQTDLDTLDALIREHGVRLALNPLHERRREHWIPRGGPLAQQMRHRSGIEVELWDERLTSRRPGCCGRAG